jgi:hypothetical protein
MSYRLLFDDNTEDEIFSSNTMQLGVPLLYYGSGANPRPVDPFVIPLDDIGLLYSPAVGNESLNKVFGRGR